MRRGQGRGFGHPKSRAPHAHAGLYTRLSPGNERYTKKFQLEAMWEFALRKRWRIEMTIAEEEPSTTSRPRRNLLMEAAREKKIDVILVWRLDRWGLSIDDLLATLQELRTLKVGFASVAETFDLTDRSALAVVNGLYELEQTARSERVFEGLEDARQRGTRIGRPGTISARSEEILALGRQGFNQSQIARLTGISRSSVRRILRGALP